MICVNNDSRCIHQGYCSCHHNQTAEASSGCGELLIFFIFGVVVSFLYPSIKIARSNAGFDSKGSQKFAGAAWLFVSPLFAMLPTMLFQIVFALGACAAGSLQVKITNSVHIAAIFLIYFAATGLSAVTFIAKNRNQIRLFVIDSNDRSVSKFFILCGGLIITAIALLTLLGAILTIAGSTLVPLQNNSHSKKLFVDSE